MKYSGSGGRFVRNFAAKFILRGIKAKLVHRKLLKLPEASRLIFLKDWRTGQQRFPGAVVEHVRAVLMLQCSCELGELVMQLPEQLWRKIAYWSFVWAWKLLSGRPSRRGSGWMAFIRCRKKQRHVDKGLEPPGKTLSPERESITIFPARGLLFQGSFQTVQKRRSLDELRAASLLTLLKSYIS